MSAENEENSNLISISALGRMESFDGDSHSNIHYDDADIHYDDADIHYDDEYDECKEYMDFEGVIGDIERNEKTLRRELEEKRNAFDKGKKQIWKHSPDRIAELEKDYKKIKKVHKNLRSAIRLEYRRREIILLVLCSILVFVLFVLAVSRAETIGYIFVIIIFVVFLIIALAWTIHTRRIYKKSEIWLDKPLHEVERFIELRNQKYSFNLYIS